MFLHIGGDVIVPKKDIVGIFSNESTLINSYSKEFLENMKSEKKIINIGEKEKAKSFIITKESVYISPISSNTLLKRAENIKDMINDWE